MTETRFFPDRQIPQMTPKLVNILEGNCPVCDRRFGYD
jgi:hypothetical protein